MHRTPLRPSLAAAIRPRRRSSSASRPTIVSARTCTRRLYVVDPPPEVDREEHRGHDAVDVDGAAGAQHDPLHEEPVHHDLLEPAGLAERHEPLDAMALARVEKVARG